MIKKIPFIIVVVVLFSSCRKSVSEIPAILIDISHERKTDLSEIAEKVDVVKLETTESSLIQQIRNVEILNGHYFIHHGTYSEVLMFDLNGQFIKKVGQIGRGPKEYIAVTNIAVDTENQRLLLNTRELMMFDGDGVFIESVEHGNRMPASMFIHNKLLYGLHVRPHWASIENQGEGTTYFITTRNTTDWKLIDSIYFTHFPGNKLQATGNNFSQDKRNIYFYLQGKKTNASGRISDVDTLYILENKKTAPYLTAQIVGKGENGGYVERIEMTDNYGIITHSISVRDADARWPRSVYSQYYFNLRTMKGENATNGFIDDFHNGENVIITPIPNTNKFYYYATDYSDLETVPNPILYIGTFKK